MKTLDEQVKEDMEHYDNTTTKAKEEEKRQKLETERKEKKRAAARRYYEAHREEILGRKRAYEPMPDWIRHTLEPIDDGSISHDSDWPPRIARGGEHG